MRVYRGEGIGSIYAELLRDVTNSGRRVTVRGQSCMEFTEPVTLVYEKPGHCFMSIPGRKINPFFALAEVFWILTGRGSVEWIAYFNSQMRQFSDGGKDFHGSYGKRLRKWINNVDFESSSEVDQIQEVVKKLKADPFTRQAVMTLWDPVYDNLYKSKDYPCLAGDTVIWSPEGNRKIKRLARKFSQGKLKKWPVYSVDPDSGGFKITWATDIWKSGKKRVTKISFDDGSSLTLTKDHKLYRRKRIFEGKRCIGVSTEKIPAGELSVGDRVWATQKWYSPKGHEWVKLNLNSNTSYDNRQFVHRTYSELLDGPLPEGWDVHHDNEIKTDNQKQNLKRMEHGEHAVLNMIDGKNPMQRMSKKDRIKKGRTHSQILKGREYSDSHCEAISKGLRGRVFSEEHKEAISAAKKGRELGSHSLSHREALSQAAKQRWARERDTVNHVVTKIEDAGTQDVYDFTVPKYHTAVVGTGVVAHNCNNMLYHAIRDGKLNQTVIQRSNDLILGTPYNAIQFSHLHALVAGELDVEIGTLTYVIQNLHYYYDLYPKVLSNLLEWAFEQHDISSRHYYGNHGALAIPGFTTTTDAKLKELDNRIQYIFDAYRDDKQGASISFGAFGALPDYWGFTIPAMIWIYTVIKEQGKEQVMRNNPLISEVAMTLRVLGEPLVSLVKDFYSDTENEFAKSVIREVNAAMTPR